MAVYARARPRPFPARRRPPPGPKPLTEQQFTEMVSRLTTYLPRRVASTVVGEFDETVRLKGTKFSLRQFVFSPVKTVKRAIRSWVSLNLWRQIPRELEAAFVWEPILATSGLAPTERTAILEWVRYGKPDWIKGPAGLYRKVDVGFENLKQLRNFGYIDATTWDLIRSRAQRQARLTTLENITGRKIWSEYIKKPLIGERKALLKVPQIQAAKGALRRGLKAIARRIAQTGIGRAVGGVLRSALGGAIGLPGGAPGVAAGVIAFFLGGKFLKGLWKFARDITLASCGCLAMFMAGFLGLVIVVVGGAFQPGETGGGVPGQRLVLVEKTADPDHVDVGPNPIVEFTITASNLGGEEITDGTLTDEYDQDNFTPSALGGADDSEAGKLIWTIDSIPPGGSVTKIYDGFISADTDKVVVNNTTFTGTLGGNPVSNTGSAYVVVGNPEGQPPSGWPVVEGCITQGPYANDTHQGVAAIDIAPVPAGVSGAEVWATHDGKAYVYYSGSGPYPVLGNYIIIESPNGFKSYYGHLESTTIPQEAGGYQVYPGQIIGTMGSSGNSTNVHLHYEFRGLPMRPPYIPVTVGPCVGRDVCNYCF